MIWQVVEGAFAIVGVAVTAFVGWMVAWDALDSWKLRKSEKWRKLQ